MAFPEKCKFFRESDVRAAQNLPETRERKSGGRKMSKASKSLLLGLAILLATSAFAGNPFAANQGSVQLTSPVTVSGQAVPAGHYSVKWEGSGPNVQMSILKGNRVVATAPARVLDLTQSPSNDAAVLQSNPDGSKSLAEVRFSGKKYALAIGGDASTADSGSK
jgi:hypothetical protein